MSKNKKRLIRILLSFAIFVPCFVLHLLDKIDHNVLLGVTLVNYLIIGYDIIWKSIRNISKGRFLDENFLMLIATIGAFAIGEYLEAVAVMIFYQTGELFQDFAVGKSRKSIASLMDIRPEVATVLRDGQEIQLAPEEVEIGDYLIVKCGEKIPLDGIVISGTTSLDTKALTGESVPRDVQPQDEVLSGSINVGGVIQMQATKIYFDSTVSKILDLVENAAGKKAQSEAFITKFARFYTPSVVFLALLLGLVPPCFDGLWSVWVFRALTFLVVSCPCALVISVPLGFFCGIGGASKSGILVKGGSYLELLNKVNVFVFDKTGTLTKGNFEVVSVQCAPTITEKEVLYTAAICEKNSNHPIAKGIMNRVKDVDTSSYEIAEVAGLGMIAQAEETIYVGNAKLMEENHIPYIVNNGVGSVVYVARNNQFLGSILVADTIKDSAKETISQLNKSGYKTIMLTGDNALFANAVAKELGIQEVKSELLPQNKVEAVEQIINEKQKKDVIGFIGDGINDAPVLMRADVGISMGGIGSDSAIEASDVVLMYDNLDGILQAKKVARKTTRIVIENIVFSLVIKGLVLVLSALGYADMWVAIFADVGVAVIAILNAMRCLRTRKQIQN